MWTEHTTPDGKRKYWHNKSTGASVWRKPDELKTDAERALDACPWKEFVTPAGRKYWNNALTKVSSWTMPEEYAALHAAVESEMAAQVRRSAVQQNALDAQEQQAAEDVLQQQAAEADAAAAQLALDQEQQENEKLLDFDTFAQIDYKGDNERAFINMLRMSRITSDCKWDEALRVVINNPLYRLLNTSAERKDAFEKYRAELRRYENELERMISAKRRDQFQQLLISANVTPLTRYSLLEKKHRTDKAWLAFKSDTARREQFDQYQTELRRAEREAARAQRQANMKAFEALLPTITEINDGTSWAEAHELFTKHADYVDSPMAKMDLVDCLSVFQHYVTELDRQESERRREERDERIRLERQRRCAFKMLLADMKERSAINVYTKWKEIYPTFAEDPRYLDMLGQPGSSPMDLYRDLIVDLEEAVYRDGVIIKDVLKSQEFVVMPDTDFADFAVKIASDERMSKVDEANVQVVFDVLRDKAKRKLRDAMREETRAQERRLRRHYSDFKYMLQRSGLPITSATKWEDIRDNFYGRATLEAVGVNEAATLFGKYVRRLAEKEARRLERQQHPDGAVRGRSGGRQDRKRQRRARSSRSRSRHSSVSTASSRSSSRGGARGRKSSVAQLVAAKDPMRAEGGNRIAGEASSDEEGIIAE